MFAKVLKQAFSVYVYAQGVCVCFSHQQTVEKDMDKHPQRADDEVNEVVEELKVQHHGFVAAREGSSVPHKTYQEDDFITHLEDKVNLSSIIQIQNPLIILTSKNQHGLGSGSDTATW